MQAVAYSKVRNNLKSFMKKVNDDADVILITSNQTENQAVLISQAEYDNLLENAYVRSSKENLDHIKSSWESLKKGQGKAHEWD